MEETTAPAAIPAESNGHGETASIFDGIRARRAAVEQAAKEQLVLEVPGYGGELAARYNRVRARGITRMLVGEDAAEDYADLLIRACDSILIRVDGELIPLHEHAEEFTEAGPIRWGDERLAQALDLKDYTGRDGMPKARKLLLKVLGDDENLLVTQGIALAGWLVRANDEDDSDF